MQKKALVIIDIQNDITKNYKDVIGNINKAIDWAANKIDEMLRYYESKGSKIIRFNDLLPNHIFEAQKY